MRFAIVEKLAKRDFSFADDQIGELAQNIKYFSASHAPIELWRRVLPHVESYEQNTAVCIAFAGAASYGDTQLCKQLYEYAKGLNDELPQRMLRDNNHRAFALACENGHLETAKVVAALGGDKGVKDALAANEYGAFRTSCHAGETETLNFLVQLARDHQCLPSMLASDEYKYFVSICDHRDADTVKILIGLAKEHKCLKEMLTAGEWEVFAKIVQYISTGSKRHIELLHMMITDDAVAPYWRSIISSAKRSGNDIMPIIKEGLEYSKNHPPMGEHPDKTNWKRITHSDVPHYSLMDMSCEGFKKKLYDELLPIMQLAARAENYGNQEGSEMRAYKLSMLFANMDEVRRYFIKYEKEWKPPYTKQPIHDAVLFHLPSAGGKWSVSKWKDAIMRDGQPFLKALAQAPEIEAYLAEHGQPFPASPAELEAVRAQLSFKRATENPAFAALAFAVGLQERMFDEALDLLKTKGKTKDHLPDMLIDGAEIGIPNFYMEKLKPDDPIGLVLGELTNCCQSVGGNGDHCARHGMTSQNGGFYVWKHKTKNRRTPRDKIVAQSWVWLGTDNALVFDSFERLAPEYDALVKPFLEQLTHDVVGKHTFTRDDKETVITAVKLGRGGNTPELEYSSAISSIPIDHDGYGDSNNQYSVPAVNHKEHALSRATKVEYDPASRQVMR